MGAGQGRAGNPGGTNQTPPIPQKINPFPPMDNSPFHQLADEDGYLQKQTFSQETKDAIEEYLDPNPVRGSLYAPSQELNHAMRTGAKLTPAQQTMRDNLLKGMHNLGENLNLVRYDRVGFMDGLGIKNYDKKSIATLRKQLLGYTYDDKAFVSVSMNNFSKASRYNPFTDKAVKINIKAPAKTQALMPGTGKGGDFGEMILAPNQKFRITDVRFTGKQGRSGANYYKQIELDVEIM